jgi:hypothetical protein
MNFFLRISIDLLGKISMAQDCFAKAVSRLVGTALPDPPGLRMPGFLTLGHHSI